MFGDYASNLMFLPNLTRRELLHFVAGGGLTSPRGITANRPPFFILRFGARPLGFIDSMHSLDRSMVLHHVVNTYRLNKSAGRNARSDPPPGTQVEELAACRIG